MIQNVYKKSDDGKLLIDWLSNDWGVFQNSSIENGMAGKLLEEILGQEVSKDLYKPSDEFSNDRLMQWDNLRDELMYENRWFLDSSFDKDRLNELLDMLSTSSIPKQWYRARATKDNKIFNIENMGAPPSRETANGRANPVGIPYLYLGSQVETAISEVRPHVGELVCVAEFLISDISVADLRNPRKLISPFVFDDVNDIRKLREDLPLLEKLGIELTVPIQKEGAAIDYIPSQYLCEFIKKKGFDGVIYNSSVSDGINLALFYPDKAIGGNVTCHEVIEVQVRSVSKDI